MASDHHLRSPAASLPSPYDTVIISLTKYDFQAELHRLGRLARAGAIFGYGAAGSWCRRSGRAVRCGRSTVGAPRVRVPSECGVPPRTCDRPTPSSLAAARPSSFPSCESSVRRSSTKLVPQGQNLRSHESMPLSWAGRCIDGGRRRAPLPSWAAAEGGRRSRLRPAR